VQTKRNLNFLPYLAEPIFKQPKRVVFAEKCSLKKKNSKLDYSPWKETFLRVLRGERELKLEAITLADSVQVLAAGDAEE